MFYNYRSVSNNLSTLELFQLHTLSKYSSQRKYPLSYYNKISRMTYSVQIGLAIHIVIVTRRLIYLKVLKRCRRSLDMNRRASQMHIHFRLIGAYRWSDYSVQVRSEFRHGYKKTMFSITALLASCDHFVRYSKWFLESLFWVISAFLKLLAIISAHSSNKSPRSSSEQRPTTIDMNLVITAPK